MADDNKSRGLVGAFLGMDATGKLVGLLTMGLVVAVFFVGYFYGQLKLSGGVGNTGSVAGVQGQDQAAAQPQAQPEEPVELTEAQWKEVLENPAAARGEEGAPVTVVEFTDYQCPFCARHFTQTEPQLDEKYISSGKVYHVMRDLPLPFHNNAHVAAQAARCAGDQGKYWEMHDELFDQQVTWSEGDAEESMNQLAGQIGLNTSSFSECLSSGKYKQAVDDDLALAQKIGAGGTPTFFVNGKILVGAQPLAAFESMIEEQL